MSVLPDPYQYLDGPAARLKLEYPHCRAFISDQLAEYKKNLREKLLHLGVNPEEVTEHFQKTVRNHCHRKKARPEGKPRKSSPKRG
jgi:hypothetical protein